MSVLSIGCLHSPPTHEARGWSLATLAAGNSLEFLGEAGKVAPLAS